MTEMLEHDRLVETLRETGQHALARYIETLRGELEKARQQAYTYERAWRKTTRIADELRAKLSPYYGSPRMTLTLTEDGTAEMRMRNIRGTLRFNTPYTFVLERKE